MVAKGAFRLPEALSSPFGETKKSASGAAAWAREVRASRRAARVLFIGLISTVESKGMGTSP
jgi:hypothetical protein